MLRISKLTDYAIVLLTHMAADERVHAARDLATASRVAAPTVTKVLKILANGGLLVSHRGARGGYALARPAAKINLAEVLAVMEGPVSLTECASECRGLCALERACPVRENWKLINAAVTQSLAAISLAQMTEGLPKLSAIVSSARH